MRELAYLIRQHEQSERRRLGPRDSVEKVGPRTEKRLRRVGWQDFFVHSDRDRVQAVREFGNSGRGQGNGSHDECVLQGAHPFLRQISNAVSALVRASSRLRLAKAG